MCKKKIDGKPKCIPLSANIFRRHIENIAEDEKKQALEQIMQCRRLAIQLDRSMDISNMSQLEVFAISIMKPFFFLSHKRCSKEERFSKKTDSAKWMTSLIKTAFHRNTL